LIGLVFLGGVSGSSQPPGFWEEERAYQAALQYIEQQRRELLIHLESDNFCIIRDVPLGSGNSWARALAERSMSITKIFCIIGFLCFAERFSSFILEAIITFPFYLTAGLQSKPERFLARRSYVVI
jgi:hypothetical protein